MNSLVFLMIVLLIGRVINGSPNATSSEERDASCWKMGQLQYSDGWCYEPLKRGPCLEDEWLVLDLGITDVVAGRCEVRPCGPEQLPLEGHCVGEGQARDQLCGGHRVHLNATGNLECGTDFGWRVYLRVYGNTDPFSNLRDEEVMPETTVVCGRNDKGLCQKPVESMDPGLEIFSED